MPATATRGNGPDNLLATTQMDHTAYPLTLKGKSTATLRYIIADCKAAANAMPEGHKVSYYLDEINYCVMEIFSRKGGC